MKQEIKKLFIVSGEASGDLHGSNLVKELLTNSPDLEIFAWGGDKMAAAGAKILKHYRDLAFMGFYEVIRNFPTIIRNFGVIKKQILDVNPKVVVLMDYPGFNLRLLSWLKQNDFIVIYYIAPQAWAWKENRVKKMAKYIDELLVILPFEEEFFRTRGVKTEFVGHPLLQSKLESQNLKESRQIALLPGSRKQEVEHILPLMLSVQSEISDYKFVIAAMSHIGESFYKRIIGDKKAVLIFDNSDEVIGNSEFALVSSGTATLQTALAEVPQIVCYKSGWLNYELGKRLIKVPFISLVNLIFGKEIVRELIQDNLNTASLIAEIKKLQDLNNRKVLKENYQSLRKLLGEKNASKRAAEIILAHYP